MAPDARVFGTTQDRRTVHAVQLVQGQMRAVILTYGATLQDLRLAGVPWPLTLGANSVAAYETTFAYAGPVVGPVANRIAGAAAVIDGRRYAFEANEAGSTTLHSGSTGTHAQIWQIEAGDAACLTLRLDLPDGQGGFPGNRTLRARFTLAAPACLHLTLSATTDAATLMNLANHSYWNLDGSEDIGRHRLQVFADRYLPTDARLIPREPRDVSGTGWDFREPHALQSNQALDHNFCLSSGARRLSPAARLTGARGVTLELATTAPGLQVYDGRGLDTRPWLGLTGAPYGPRAGIALEAQGWPDAPGRGDFPDIVLRPGSEYRQETVFSFERRETG